MDDGTDTGNIIYQEKVEITQDLDLGLLYHLLFALEPKVFLEGMRRLSKEHYQYSGQGQDRSSSHYTRSKSDMTVDLASMSDDEIVTRTRAFGVRSQGVVCVIGGERYRIFDAEAISNVHLLNEFIGCPASTLLLEYDGKLLVRTKDGIVKVKSYERLEK
jgi:methionyl-tRNA formyltransferase